MKPAEPGGEGARIVIDIRGHDGDDLVTPAIEEFGAEPEIMGRIKRVCIACRHKLRGHHGKTRVKRAELALPMFRYIADGYVRIACHHFLADFR